MKQIIALVAATLLIAGCSSKDKETQTTSTAAASQDIVIVTAFTPNPPKKGADTLTVTLTDGTGAPVKGATVKIDSTMPSMSMSGPSVTAKDNGDGTYTARLSLDYATSWQFTVSANAAGKTGAAKVTEDVK
jgi:nitrogen fixation protein FixH